MAVNIALPFLWGTATSAYQVEGGNEINDWYLWERRPDSVCVEPAGDACDHVHRYRQDIRLLAELGFNCYRFSVEWSRIEPAPGRFSRSWLEHYAAVADACRAAGMHPVVTLHHFTNPQSLSSWEGPDTARLFARYCGVVADALGSRRMALAITINEPNIPPLLGFENGVFPPGKRDRDARRRATDVFIEAHHRARAELRRIVPDVPVGLALAMADWQALPGGVAERHEVRALREDVFLRATAEDDFLGVNTYTRHRIGPHGWAGNEPGVELTDAGYEFWPEHSRRRCGAPGS